MAKKKDEPLVFDSFEELLEIIAEERRKSLKNRKQAKRVLAFFVCLIAAIVMISVVTHHNIPIGGFFGFTGVFAGMYAATQTQRKGVQALAQFEDVRAVRPLIEAMEYNDKEMKAVAIEKLPVLLPQLRASDAGLLSKEHYAMLNRILNTDLNTRKPAAARMRIAVLQALQQVGNESSLPVVEDLAVGKGKAAGYPEVRRAAADCLPFLRVRVDHLRQTQTLLRASDGNLTPPDVLLRPAAASDVTVHADELLRAAPAEQTDDVPATAVQTVSVQEEQKEQSLRLS
jgi:hypothetical protein